MSSICPLYVLYMSSIRPLYVLYMSSICPSARTRTHARTIMTLLCIRVIGTRMYDLFSCLISCVFFYFVSGSSQRCPVQLFISDAAFGRSGSLFLTIAIYWLNGLVLHRFSTTVCVYRFKFFPSEMFAFLDLNFDTPLPSAQS